MTNETRAPHKCPTCKASFTDDGEFIEHMGGQCTPSPIEPQPDDYSGAMVRDYDDNGDPADFAREMVERIRGRINDAPMPTERLLDEAADLIEQLLAEHADAVQAGEKIGRARGRRFARKVSQRHAKHGARL